MRVLITGAAGFIGGHLRQDLAALGFETIGAVRALKPEAPAALYGAELADRQAAEKLIAAAAPAVIVHCAAAANSGYCEANPEAAWQSNVTAVENLCAAAAAFDPAVPLLHLSTDLVFDGCKAAPPGGFSESDKPHPITVYGRTKSRAEEIVLELPGGIVLRTALVYGPPIGAAAGMMGWLLGTVRRGQPVQLFTDEWRTPIYVGDIARAAAAVISSSYMKSAPRRDRILNLAGPQRLNRHDFGLIAAEIFDFTPELLKPALRREFLQNNQDVPYRPEDVSLKISLLENRVGITPLSVRDGMFRCRDMPG